MVTDSRDCEDGVKELLGVDLFEITITPSPANNDTRIVSVKSATTQDIRNPDFEAIRKAGERAAELAEFKRDYERRKRQKAKLNRPVRVATFEVG